MKEKAAFRKKLVNFVEKYELWFYGITVLLYLIGIPLSIAVFPNATIATYILLAFTGITSSVGSLASALLSSDQNKREKNKENEE